MLGNEQRLGQFFLGQPPVFSQLLQFFAKLHPGTSFYASWLEEN